MNSSKFQTERTGVEQVTNNSTGWVGHHPLENNEIGKGQTFISSTEADVETIAVYSNLVSQPGSVEMTVHSYDPLEKRWGPAMGSATVNFTKRDSGKWVAFNLPQLHLAKGKSYGFRLNSHDSYIGVGEAAGSAKQPPFMTGQEWQFSNNGQKADAFSYFSLAFKVGLRA